MRVSRPEIDLQSAPRSHLGLGDYYSRKRNVSVVAGMVERVLSFVIFRWLRGIGTMHDDESCRFGTQIENRGIMFLNDCRELASLALM